MARIQNLTALHEKAVRALPGMKTVKEFDAKFSQKSATAADVNKAQANWIKSVKAPQVKQPAAKPIQGVKLTSTNLNSLRAIVTSSAAAAEIVNQQMSPDQILGVVHSSLATFEYTKLKSDYQKERAAAAAKDKPAVDAQWQQVVQAGLAFHAAAGVKDLKEADLDQMAKVLNSNKANFGAATAIANTAVDAGPAKAATTPKKAAGNFVTQTGVLANQGINVTSISVGADPRMMAVSVASLCSKPIAQGTFTKHLGNAWSLKATVPYWCGSFWHPFKFCTKVVTIATVSFSVDLSVGYRVTCCGATAWGSAAVQACAKVAVVKACATCTASITGVAGVGRTGSGSNCSYGLGVKAELKCTLGGITVFQASAPFGWTITGPCPPAGIKC